ncbi:MAG: tetratricopeptide repeat protein [Rhodospirillaceae bacterium]
MSEGAGFADPFATAVAYHQGGRHVEAEALYRRILAVAPDHVAALNNLALLVAPEEAEALFGQALALRPDYADAHQNLGMFWRGRGEHALAAASFEQALRFRPGDPLLLFNLGAVWGAQGQNCEAIACFRLALEARPADPDILFSLSVALSNEGEQEEAAAICARALGHAPGYAAGFLHLGNIMRSLGRLARAIDAYRSAIVLQPDCVDAVFYLGLTLHAFNRFEVAIRQFEHVLILRPDRVDVRDSLLMTLSYTADCPIGRLLAEHRRYERMHTPPLPIGIFANSRDPERRLRVGYVSDELCEHFAGYFVEPLVLAHDRRAVETFCYSGTPRHDAATGRLREICDGWRDTAGLGDEAMAALIRDDSIDILVDLSGHAAPNRLPVFARKPAPVQMSWLGYPATTGLSAMDYRLVDAVTDPDGEADRAVTEALVRVRTGFLCFRPPAASDVRDSPVMEMGRIRFGSFNALSKITPRVIALWAALLLRVPRATLTLKDWRLHYAEVRRHVEAEFASHGVVSDRLELLHWTPDLDSHLEAFHRLDVALDPFPYNGTTTTCEALWMGVPVVTLRGDRHAGRVGASLLTRVGLEELVAADEETYLMIAASLACDPGRLERLRRGMRERLRASSLCDADTFAHHVETAYRIMWRRWCGGEGARAFTV